MFDAGNIVSRFTASYPVPAVNGKRMALDSGAGFLQANWEFVTRRLGSCAELGKPPGRPAPPRLRPKTNRDTELLLH